jgi:hypothetical protein
MDATFGTTAHDPAVKQEASPKYVKLSYVEQESSLKPADLQAPGKILVVPQLG